MQQRQLGPIQVSAIGLGCMNICHAYGAPVSEQQASAACVCLSLVNAALASGWGAAWLTGWVSHDPEFSRVAFDLAEGETVAGLVHIGRATSPVPDRPRPDVAALTRWVSA